MSVIGIFSSYLTFYHRSSFQTQVITSKQEDIQVFTFSKSEFDSIVWEETNREFELEGKMYDVARIEYKDNKYFVYCENDYMEDLLISMLKTTGKSKCKMNPAIQFFEPVGELICESCFSKSQQEEHVVTNFYRSLLPEAVAPPPRFT
ncbi:hypothetical protein WSM22_30090 [Cytophagales bacterium WSM2-2]|nr:hypothetical protein WSM22_30090 [Cytophagales bacterium WSM2-2]